MLRGFLNLLLICLGQIIWAQNLTNSQDYLDNSLKILKNPKTLTKIDFELEYSLIQNKQVIPQTKKGVFYLLDTKYYMVIGNIEWLFDGVKLYTINHADKEVVISKESQSIMEMPLTSIYDLKENYSITWDILKKEGDNNIQFLKLSPKKGKQILYIGINKTTNYLHQIIRVDSENRSHFMNIKNIKLNPPKTTSRIFIFKNTKFPKYEILDVSI